MFCFLAVQTESSRCLVSLLRLSDSHNWRRVDGLDRIPHKLAYSGPSLFFLNAATYLLMEHLDWVWSSYFGTVIRHSRYLACLAAG